MKYRVIIADPPWQYNNKDVRGGAEHHYPTMSTAEVCALPVGQLANDDSLLLLWANWAMLPDAMEVIKSWGFTYKTGFPWLKVQGGASVDLWGEINATPVWGTGWWVRGCTEMVLIAVRGKISPEPDPPLGLLCSERFEHSRKPENLYEYAERWHGPYLELFARRDRQGWDRWGNEVESTVGLT